MRIAVALSGGVDSAVAAGMLVGEGHDVVGITLQQWPRDGSPETERHGGCCSLNAVEDARRVASLLGVPYYCWNLESEFGTRVIEPFHQAYRDGLTPNPCMRCNALVRFDLMLHRVLALGFDALATGHYARIEPGPDGPQLHMGVDPAKDQSYVLYHLDRERLSRLMFPIGGMRKPEVRALAAAMGLPVAAKAESQEICFVPRGRTAEYLASNVGGRPGPVENLAGATIGRHRGTALYTVGQRTGLTDLTAPGPWYVVRIDPAANRLVVGRREDLGVTRVRLREVTFIGSPPPQPLRCSVRLRYHAEPREAVFESGELLLSEAFEGVAPGQTAVMYAGTRVLGGGVIERLAAAPVEAAQAAARV